MRILHYPMMSILLLITTGLLAQKRQITGKVLDPSGSPIPAATIKIKGTQTGTSADFDGLFKLDVSEGNSLIVSGIGYEPREIKVGSSVTFTIQLNTDSRSLSEVVVTGTGTATSKRKGKTREKAREQKDIPGTPDELHCGM